MFIIWILLGLLLIALVLTFSNMYVGEDGRLKTKTLIGREIDLDSRPRYTNSGELMSRTLEKAIEDFRPSIVKAMARGVDGKTAGKEFYQKWGPKLNDSEFVVLTSHIQKHSNWLIRENQ
jgi:hypothetical protein